MLERSEHLKKGREILDFTLAAFKPRASTVGSRSLRMTNTQDYIADDDNSATLLKTIITTFY